jgi:cytochrome c556
MFAHPTRNAPSPRLALGLAAASLLLATAASVQTAEAQPKYTTKQVMKTLHKGQDNIAKHVTQGQGTAEEIAKLVEYYQSLPLNKAPKGDSASWEAKTMALLKAAEALKAGQPGALAGYKQAVNCKACHSMHKPD